MSFGWPYTLSSHDQGLLIEDVWPTLFFGAERIECMRRLALEQPWARAMLEELRSEAERTLRSEPALPVERVGWRHEYCSPSTGEHLLYDPSSPRRHYDPWSGERCSGEEWHEAWVLLTHERTCRIMRSIGVLYSLQGEERHAEWVRRGLQKAAAMFARHDLRHPQRSSALYFQALYEYAAGQIDGSAYAPLLAVLAAASGGRGGLAALAYGPRELPALPEAGVTARLSGRLSCRTGGPVTADWRISDTLWLRAIVSGEGYSEVTWGRTPGNPIPASRGTLVVRTCATACRFRTVLEVHHGAPTIRKIDPAAFVW